MTHSAGFVMTALTAALLAGCVQVQTGGSGSGGLGNSNSGSAASASKGSGVTCSDLTPLGGRYDAVVEGATFDQALFDSAVLHYTNERRCANGSAPLAADAGLSKAAAGHSADMVALNFYDHTSPAPGRTKMTDRLNLNGVSYRAAAENIGRASRLKLVGGKPFTVQDRTSCTYAYNGETIAPHSYRTLAQKMVQDWEGSPRHRKNLFNSAYTRLGNGASFARNPQTCGDFIATQNFAA